MYICMGYIYIYTYIYIDEKVICIYVIMAPVYVYMQVMPRKVDIRLPGEGYSDSYGVRPVFLNHLEDTVHSDQ